MEKKFIFLFTIFLVIAFYKCDEVKEEEEEFDDAELYNHEKDVAEFKKGLKEYLVKNNLFDSDRIIEREEMKKIFLEIILDQNTEEFPDYLKGVVDFLTKIFLDKYYKKLKVIKGKDIYDLIDILAISRKFKQLTGDPDYDDFEDEEMEGEDMTDL